MSPGNCLEICLVRFVNTLLNVFMDSMHTVGNMCHVTINTHA